LNDNDRNKRVAGDGQPHAAAAHCAAAIAALRDFALAQGRSGSLSSDRHGADARGMSVSPPILLQNSC
jgi:hypothetical protein